MSVPGELLNYQNSRVGGGQAVRKVNLGSTIATGSICEANFYELVKKEDRSQMPVIVAVRRGEAGLEREPGLRCRPIAARQRLDEKESFAFSQSIHMACWAVR